MLRVATNVLFFAYKISRFRFWIYTAGTYVVGFALGANSLSSFFMPEYFIFLFYFFIPANIFLYGVNDYWDAETDLKNPKKGEKEYRIIEQDRRQLRNILLVMTALSLFLFIFIDSISKVILTGFILLSYFYSAKPLRFKAIPGLDSISNALYLVPGILGYYLAAGELPPVLILAAGMLHTTAMHLFSAIPDIECDSIAKIRTSAVELGKERALIACLFLWAGLALLAVVLTKFHPLSILAFIYPTIPFLLIVRKSSSVERLYWYLPYINTALGGLLFIGLVTRLI